jgi:hypothetical protein
MSERTLRDVVELSVDEASRPGDLRKSPERRDTLVACYTAYYDASGKQTSREDDEFVVVAGIVASEKQWGRIERLWNRVLEANHVRHIDTAGIVAARAREFRPWFGQHEKRNRMFARLAAILRDNAAFGYHAGARLDDFKRINGVHPFAKEVADGDLDAGAYSFYAMVCLERVMKWRYATSKKIHGIIHLIESGDDGTGALEKSIRRQGPKYRNSSCVISKIDEETGIYKVPFQACDLFAWYARKHWQWRLEETPRNFMPDCLDILRHAFPHRRTHTYEHLEGIIKNLLAKTAKDEK